MLSSTVTGGTWSSSATSIASVAATGRVYGITPGVVVVYYTKANTCGTATASRTVTVTSSRNEDANNMGTVANNVAGNMNVYPNPTNGLITVELTGTTVNHSLLVTDIAGKVITTQETADSKLLIDLSSQPKGTYLLKVVAGAEVFTAKIVVE